MNATPVNPLELELEEILAAHGNSNYQAGKQYGYHSDNMRDKAKREALKALNAHLYKEVKSLLPERKELEDVYEVGYNQAIEDMEAAAKERFK